MMRVVFDENREPKAVISEVRDRYPVYLDTDMLVELASESNGRDVRRARFVSALRRRGTLLFSEANAVEVGRLDGDNAARAASFLSSLGEFWVPLRMSAFSVLERQDEPDPGPLSRWFLELYVEYRMGELVAAGTTLDKSSEAAFGSQFFDLGAILGLSLDDGTYRAHMDQLYVAVRDGVAKFLPEYAKDKASLESRLPRMQFTPQSRLLYVVRHLLRTLVAEARGRRLMENDGIDFCHASMAATYGSIVALDKAWKARVEALEIPREFLNVFYRPEADELVTLLEDLVDVPPGTTTTLRTRRRGSAVTTPMMSKSP